MQRRWDEQGNLIEDERGLTQPPAPSRPMPRQMRPIEQRLNDPNPDIRAEAERQRTQRRWDEQGNPVPEIAATPQEAQSDAARSLVTGVERGVGSAAGQPGDAHQLVGNAARLAAQSVSSLFGRPMSDADATNFGNLIASHVVPGGPVPRTSTEQNETIADLHQAVTGEPQHEPTTRAGRYAETIGEFAPGALMPGGVAQRVTRVVAPAVASEAAGELTHGTPLEPVARFAAALAASGVSEGTINLLTRQGLTPDQRALRLIMRELDNAGFSPDQIVRTANKLTARAPTEEIMAELMNDQEHGSPGLRLARATAAMGQGSGRSIAEETLNSRATGRPGPVHPTNPNTARGVTSISDRVMGEAARAYAPDAPHAPNNYWDMLDTLRKARAGQGAENYRAAYAQPLDQAQAQQHLVPLMREAPEAAQSGARQLDTEAQRLIGQRSQLSLAANPDQQAIAALDAEIGDTRAAAVQLRAIAGGETPNAIGTRAVDYFQRGLQQAEQSAGHGSPEAGALGNFRRGFNGLADRIAPALGDTRAQYGRSMRIEDMTELGRKVFNMSDGELERAMRGPNGQPLSTEEFDGFQLGVLDAIEHRLGQGDTAFLARLARNKNWQAQLERATGSPANARRFMDRLAREASMQRTRNAVLSGSQTTPIAEDIRALTEGESELGFLNAPLRGLVQSGGNWRQLALRVATGIWDRVHRPGIANPQVQEAMARRLFQQVSRKGAQQLRDELMASRNDPSVSPALRQWLNRVVAFDSARGHVADERPQSTGGGAAEPSAPFEAPASPATRPPALYVVGSSPSGLVTPGNIDLNNRQVVRIPRNMRLDTTYDAAGRPVTAHFEDDAGAYSTEHSMSFEENGREILIPMVSDDGRPLSEQQAIEEYHRTGHHLGMFDSVAHANAYADALHRRQMSVYDARAQGAR